MSRCPLTDETAHAPRETRDTERRSGHLDAGGPRRPLIAHRAAPEAWRRRCRPASPFMDSPGVRDADRLVQPMRVLPGSMRTLIDWRVIELVNVTSMRPCVPPLLLTTWLQPSALLSTTL